MGTKDKNLEEIDRVASVLDVLRAELHKETRFNTCSDSGNVNAPALFRELWQHFFTLSPLCQASVDMYANDDPLVSIADAQRIVMTELMTIRELLCDRPAC